MKENEDNLKRTTSKLIEEDEKNRNNGKLGKNKVYDSRVT